MAMKLPGAQNQAFSGCGGKYFPGWSGNILPAPLQDPVVAPAGSALRVWLSHALDFWAQPARRPFKGNPDWPLNGNRARRNGTLVFGHVLRSRISALGKSNPGTLHQTNSAGANASRVKSKVGGRKIQ